MSSGVLTCLHNADEEAIREATTRPAMKSAGTASPLLCNRLSISAIYFHSRSMAPIRRKLESGGIYNAIEFVLLTVRYDAFLGDRIHSLPLSVHELDRWFVERSEIFVMKARALTKLVVIWLQAFGSLFVLYDFVDTASNLLHFLEVGELSSPGELFGTCCVTFFGSD